PPRPEPVDGVRPLSALWRTHPLLGQPGDPGAGDNVDPAAHAAGLRPRQAMAAVRIVPGTDADDGVAMARQHAPDRYFCRIVCAVAVSSRRAWRQAFRA